MMSEDNLNEAQIENWIREKQSFVLYRLPQTSVCRVLWQQHPVCEMSDIACLDGKCGFVFAPFHVDASHPIFLLEPEKVFEFYCQDQVETDGSTPLEVHPSASYLSCFESFMRELQAGVFQKLVLSRSCRQPKEAGFSLLQAFKAACSRFVYSYVYLFYTPAAGCWMGCTPEIILSGGDKAYHTVALAGTQSLVAGVLPTVWDQKNREEQQYVTEYMLHRLETWGVKPYKNGPFPVKAGALAHLKTEIAFQLSQTDRLGSLLKELHPTPAVCGLPKEKAYQFIRTHEDQERSYYSGFLGWLDPQGQTDLYVNLRSMQITAQHFILYAGGGILPSSVVQDEWLETEKKMGTMRCVIAQGYSD